MYRKSVTGLPMQFFMTLLWIMIAWGPIANDFNETHLFNPGWPPHAKLHMMTMITSGVSLAVFGLYIVWGKTASRLERLRLSAVAGFLYMLALIIASMTMPMYGGSMSSEDTAARAATLADVNYVVFLVTGLVFLVLTVMLHLVREDDGV
jgi:hypothetical protein